MNNSIYKDLAGANQPSMMANLQNALMQIKQNPAAMLKQSGFNLPDGVDFRNPQNILNYLLQSGQVNQARLAQAQQIAAKMGR